MSGVTCPRCRTRQELGGDAGYTCSGCGTSWTFAACANCGVRFHMRPGTTAWTCPECGYEHGVATMVDLGPQPERMPPTVVARHAAAPRARVKRPPTRRRLAALAALGIASVLVVAFALSSLGAELGVAASPTQTDSPPASPTTSASATEALCLHLRDLQTPREDSFARLAETLEGDAAGFEAAGKQNLAEAVARMQVAVLAYRDALAAQADTSAAGAQIAAALGDLPCGAGG